MNHPPNSVAYTWDGKRVRLTYKSGDESKTKTIEGRLIGLGPFTNIIMDNGLMHAVATTEVIEFEECAVQHVVSMRTMGNH